MNNNNSCTNMVYCCASIATSGLSITRVPRRLTTERRVNAGILRYRKVFIVRV